MDARVIPAHQLASEIARRASVTKSVHSPDVVSLAQLAGQALTLIEGGQRDVAASLFHAVCVTEPGNAEAHNNFGFCRLPDEPAEALEHLTLADGLGYQDRAMNAVDRMQALLMVGQPRNALKLAERILADWDQLGPRLPAYLWSFPVAGPRLIFVADARPVAMALAAAAASRLNDDEDLWQKRHTHYCGELLLECECQLAVPRS